MRQVRWASWTVGLAMAFVGFVSRGRGVTVHRASCANVKRLDPERMVVAEWGAASGG